MLAKKIPRDLEIQILYRGKENKDRKSETTEIKRRKSFKESLF